MSGPKDTGDIRNCNKCGLCMSVCPVYKTLKEEQAAPRARLRLIKAFEEQDLEASPLLKELISKCLMCGSCSAICPSGVNHYAQFMDMREKMARELGEIPAIKTLVYLLAREYRIRMGAGAARLGQKLFQKVGSPKIQSQRIGNIPLSRFPEMNQLPLRSDLPQVNAPRGKKIGSLIYFTGCATNYLFADTGRATVKILTHLGYEVIIPKGQTCCGIPMMFHGARGEAVENMGVNIHTLQRAWKKYNCSAVVTDCSTCGAALMEEYPQLLKDIQDRGEALPKGIDPDLALDMAARTRDILSLILDHRKDLRFKSGGKTAKVTYHLPCHSKNSFNAQPVVNTLMAELPCFDYHPVPDMAACCGGGGTFFYEQPEISGKMVQNKRENALKSGADLWLTDCPVCRINLTGNLTPEDELEVRHPVVVIADNLED
ncbi:MAG: (Fe-S)-binding protein [Desulfobacterales bacterium]|nr:(Fe-S)-binding protein [Desulfobacterales bacterium]